MADILFLAQPILLMCILAVWIYCIVDSLRNHRPWPWVVLLVFLPVLSAVFYLVNYKFFPARNGAGRFDKALSDNRRLRSLQEEAAIRDVPGVHREIAAILFERGDFREALDALKKALDRNPEDLRSQYQAGVAMIETGSPQAAIPHLQYVLEEEPRYGYGEARLALANAYAALKQDDDAFQEYSRVVTDYNLPEAVVKHAQMLRGRGEHEKAREELRDMLKSVSSLPKDRIVAHRPWIKQAADDLKSMG